MLNSSIPHDPNRPDTHESIVRLLGQVITASLDVVKVVKGLPALGLGIAFTPDGRNGRLRCG
jgi:hypothetical protein